MSKTSATYCAIIGDINSSRTLKNRAAIQRSFSSAVRKVNKEFESAIASKFLVTLGDEFQGLLRSPADSYRFVRRFQQLVKNVTFSFGVGIGKLSTPLNEEALGMDGEVFYRARAALSKAKKLEQELVYDLGSPASELLNALIGMMEKEWERLTPRQRRIIELRKSLENQTDVAHKLRISQPAVSKVLLSPTIRQLDEAEKAVIRFLKLLQGETAAASP